LIIGSGIAGLRAAISAANIDSGLRIAVISKVQVMRSHSVSAEGGTAAVLTKEEGDNLEAHIYYTVKGSDFLADQDVVERRIHCRINAMDAVSLVLTCVLNSSSVLNDPALSPQRSHLNTV